MSFVNATEFPGPLQSTDGMGPNSAPKKARYATGSGFETNGMVVGKDIGDSGWQSNPDLRFPILAKPHDRVNSTMNFLADTPRYASLFAWRKPTTRLASAELSVTMAMTPAAQKRAAKLMWQHTPVSVFTLQVANYEIHKLMCTHPDGHEKFTPDWAFEHMRFIGINHTDQSEKTMNNGQRVLNMHKRGEYDVSNVWDSNLEGTNRLWYVIKREKVGSLTEYRPSTLAQRLELSNTNSKTGKTFEYVTRIVPVWTPGRRIFYRCQEAAHRTAPRFDRGRTCPCGKLAYCWDGDVKGDCVWDCGIAIRVGVVDQYVKKVGHIIPRGHIDMLVAEKNPKVYIWTCLS